jgi:hypothetical protein
MIGRTLAGVAAVLAAFWLAVQVDPATAPSTAPVTVAVPVVGASMPIACPGSLVIPVGDIGGGAGSVGSGSSDVRESTFPSGVDTPVAVGAGWASTSALATEIERVGGGDIAGLAAVACLAPRNDTWLVGGSTAIGSSARLVLTNPTGVASDVVVALYGPAGKVSQGLTVAMGPHSQSSYLLEGVSAGLATLVTHVTATAAGVTAVIQDSRLGGFLPAGIDWVVPNEGLAAHLEIPGVGPSVPDGIAGASVVRVFAPEAADVTLNLVSALGTEPWPAAQGLTMTAGQVIEIQVPPTAVATVVVDASSPVLAAAYTTVGRPPDDALQGAVERDSVWVNGQHHVAGRSYSVVVPHYAVSAVIYSATTTTFTAVDPSGATRVTATVSAGQTLEIPLAVPSGTPLSVAGPISWSVRIVDPPGFLSGLQPEDVGPVNTAVTVAPGFYVP